VVALHQTAELAEQCQWKLQKPGQANRNSLKLDNGYVHIYNKVEYKDSIAIYCITIVHLNRYYVV